MRAAVTLVIMDIVKSRTIQTRLRADVGTKADKRYTDDIYTPCRQRVDDLLKQHEGHLHDDVGDQMAVYFDHAQDAVQVAVALQRPLESNPITLPNDYGTENSQLKASLTASLERVQAQANTGNPQAQAAINQARQSGDLTQLDAALDAE
jgi:hypothetical protein